MATLSVAQATDLWWADDKTAVLILELQLEDTKKICAASKGKGREGEVSDAALAVQLYKEELERIVSIITDKKITRSIHNATRTDGAAVAASVLGRAARRSGQGHGYVVKPELGQCRSRQQLYRIKKWMMSF
jgi:hypothetical protein